MNKNQHPANNAAAIIIESFLCANPNPTSSKWKTLILANPEFAEEISDFALWHGKTRHIDESAFDEPVDEQLFNATKSELLSALYINTAPVEKARVELLKFKGPAARNIAREIGLGERVDLFNQMICGEVRAPYALLKRLSSKMGVQLAALAEVFSLNFMNRPAQAFKADGKPQHDVEPISWKQAIEAADIKEEEAERLLHLEKEMD